MSSQNDLPTKALVSTIEPIDGGVPSMTRWVCNQLEELNIKPILAWYAPWKNYPKLSIPSYDLFKGVKPGSVHQTAFGQYESHGIGCWLPELEFTHYNPTRVWKQLIKHCDLHIAVSGNALCALPYFKANIPFLAWIATPWEADRINRIRKFAFPRRLLDAIINKPILKRLEKNILNAPKGQILCLSHYTAREISKVSQSQSPNVMYMPVDTNLFNANHEQTKPWRIGFSGRYSDPRKNIELLFMAASILLKKSYDIELVLVGDRKADQIMHLVAAYGLEDNIKVFMHLDPTDLASLLQTFDIFTIPSHQEGLCIAALEAMACGVPVVSTRCGGPEDYVIPGLTGELTDNNPKEFAQKIEHICLDRQKRRHLGTSAAKWIEDYASETASSMSFRINLTTYLKRKDMTIHQLCQSLL
jgi:glycosyltransferase involved in cell wall biosynthesis